jgi:hypothetical protein
LKLHWIIKNRTKQNLLEPILKWILLY